MKIVITGCNGFIGNYLVHFFLNKGWTVYGVSRKNNNIKHKKFNWVQSSIDKRSFRLPKLDFCVHTAALSPKHNSLTIDYIKNNVIGTSNVLNSVIKSNCKKIIFLSGVSLYGEVTEKVIDETTPIVNPNIYGISKYLSECEIIEKTSIDYIILRLPGVLGENAKTPWLTKLIDNIISGQSIKVYNKEELFNNAVDLHSLSMFVDMCLSDSKIKNEIFVLGASNSMKIKDIVDYIKLHVNSNSSILFHEKNNSFTIDYSKATRFGYKATGLREMIKTQIYYTLNR